MLAQNSLRLAIGKVIKYQLVLQNKVSHKVHFSLLICDKTQVNQSSNQKSLNDLDPSLLLLCTTCNLHLQSYQHHIIIAQIGQNTSLKND